MNQNNISLEMVVKELARIREEHFGGMTSYEGEVLDAALAMLKAKEPVKPRERIYHFFADRYCYDVSPRMVTCGACGECLSTGDATTKYCPNCGQAVKWND